MDSGTGAVVSPHAVVPFVSVSVVSEALSSVETFGSRSARVDSLSTGGTNVSLGVERSSLPAAVGRGVVFSRKVVSLNSGNLVTDMVPKTVEKLANHEVIMVGRAVAYLSVVAPAGIPTSVTAVASLSEADPGGIIVVLVVEECPAFEALPWNADVHRVCSALGVHVVSLVENRWAPSPVIDVGPDSDALTVEAELVEFKGSVFPPPVGVFWVYTGPGVMGGSRVSAAVGASVTPRVKAACVVSASRTGCVLCAPVNGEGVLKERATEEAFMGMEVDIVSSILGEETSWKFVDVNSASAVSTGIVSTGLVGSVFE